MNAFRRLSVGIALGILVAARVAVVEAGVNTWTNAGPEGGNMTVLVADPRTVDVVYSGTFGRGLFKSTTGASVWAPIPLSGVISALAIDPVTPAVLYAGGNAGLSKSTNGGISWARTGTGLPTFVTALAVDPKVATTVYAGTGCCSGPTGVFKSTDAGATWSSSLSTETIGGIAIDPQTPSTVYAATGGGPTSGAGIFKTTNGGVTWSSANTGLTRSNILVVAIDPQTPSILYAGANPGGVFKSTNGGASWSPMNVGLGSLTVFALVIDPQTPTTLYAGTDGSVSVFKSTNGGASWSPSSSGLPVAFPANLVRDLAMDARTPTTLYAATDGGGVFKTTDGGLHWTATNTSLRAIPIGGPLQGQFAGHPLVLDPRTPSILYASTDGNGVFKSTNGGASWFSANIGLPAVNLTLAIDPLTPTTLYAGTPNNAGGGRASVFKSTDGGVHWTPTSLGSVFVYDLAIDPETPSTVYAGTEAGTFKTTNGGITWSALSAGPPDCVKAVAIDPKTPSTIYAGTDCLGHGVFKSTDAGTTWSPSDMGLPGIVVFLAIDPQTPSTLYAHTSGAVFKSTDGGATWTRSETGLPSDRITAVAVVPETPLTLYAGTFQSGVFKSTNGGASWTGSNAGLTNLEISALAVNSTGTCLHAGTGIGVFDFATQAVADCPPPPPLQAALSTTRQSVTVGTPALTIATIGNISGAPATSDADPSSIGVSGVTCGITQLTGAQTPFTFQAIDPNTALPSAPPNTPVDIAPGSSQDFLVTLTPLVPICALDIEFGFNCTNTGLAPILTGVNTLLLTAGPTGLCGLIASASVSQPRFDLGQTLIAGGSVTNPGLPDTAADFYVGNLRPDNSIEFFTNAGIVLGRLADLGSFRPIAVNVPLTTSFTVSQPTVFTRQWTTADQHGPYVFFVAAVKTGALAGGTIASDQILSVAAAPYSVP
jgi:photosystem II stability/assembly factor-like uncharacterized protein